MTGRLSISCLLTAAVIAAVIAAVTSAPPQSGSRGSSSSTIIFGQSHITGQRRHPVRRPSNNPARKPTDNRGGGTIQFGQTNAFSEQHSTGNQQTNRGQASGVSTQQQSGLGGATQTTNNQALVQALQQSGGGSGGGGGQQSSNNQVNIMSSQLQQNVEGTLVNVEAGNKGVVIVNTQDQKGQITDQRVVNGRPVAAQTAESSRCRYTCRHGITGKLYCCDDGTNRRGPADAIHGGQCPPKRLLCLHNTFFASCAHDGQCAASDKCCFDTCANRHVCKTADEVV